MACKIATAQQSILNKDTVQHAIDYTRAS